MDLGYFIYLDLPMLKVCIMNNVSMTYLDVINMVL